MPQMNGSGPEGKGSKSGRGLGNCSNNSPKDITRLGIGQGKRRRAENISRDKKRSNKGLDFLKF